MAELKKCPFCGGEAEVDWYTDNGNETHWFVYCCDCSCELSFGAKISKEQAIEAWNNRVNEFDAEKYEKLILADMERKHTEQQQLLSELKAVLPTTTEAEIRNKSINEFIRKLKTHPHAQYHLDKYLLEDIYEIAEQLKEE